MAVILPVAAQVKNKLVSLRAIACLKFFFIGPRTQCRCVVLRLANSYQEGDTQQLLVLYSMCLPQVGLQLLLQPASSSVVANVGWYASRVSHLRWQVHHITCPCKAKFHRHLTTSLMMCSQVVGLAYPAYATCKALDQPASAEKAHWLCYWLAFGGLTAVEGLVTQRFPGYYHLKFLLLLWLQSRRYQVCQVCASLCVL